MHNLEKLTKSFDFNITIPKMINFLFIWLVCMAFIMPIYSINMGDPFGLLNEIQTECEYQSLTIGSRLSDAFNSYDESVPFYRRFNHENHEKMNSFHRMIMLEMERRHLPHFQKDNNLKVKSSLQSTLSCVLIS